MLFAISFFLVCFLNFATVFIENWTCMVAKSRILADDDNTLHAMLQNACERENCHKTFFTASILKRNAVLATTRFSVFGLRRFSASAECESHVKSICINHHAIHSVFFAPKNQSKKFTLFSSGAS